ncbi:MAG: nuclear transport factor 2 family protein [Bacteroidota bacterium]
MKKLVALVFLFSALGFAQTSTNELDKKAIQELLIAQQKAWNTYDIEAFMEGYWKSDELTFYGSGGVIKGWQATLERYKKSYPSKDHFGKLDFVFNEIAPISEGAYYVMGEYYLTRSVGDTNGIFMLVVKKIAGDWKVIADTSAKVK